MFRRVKKWAAKAEKFIPKPKKVQVECLFEEATGERTTIIQQRDETVLSVVRAHGLEISSYCGGMCSCGTCIVDVEGSQDCLSQISSREIAVLGYSNRESARLGCQARIVGEGNLHIKLRRPM